jgi:hypothetical protein
MPADSNLSPSRHRVVSQGSRRVWLEIDFVTSNIDKKRRDVCALHAHGTVSPRVVRKWPESEARRGQAPVIVVSKIVWTENSP